MDDPRACTYDPLKDPTVLASPAGTCTGPDCVDVLQATAINKIWDGPRNHLGQKFWYAFPKTVSINQADYILYQALGPGTFLPQVNDNIRESAALDHHDLNFNPENEYSSRALARANPFGQPTPIALEDEFLLADAVPCTLDHCPGGPENLHRGTDWRALIENFYAKCKNGPGRCKIVSWQGNGDANIQWGQNLSMIREVATAFTGGANFEKLGTWFRHYHAPAVAHCGGGIGASPVAVTLPDGQSQIFDDMVSWVETGIPPHSAGDATKAGILGTASSAAIGTRPLCPWPTTAIYNGTDPTNEASSYTCGGDLDTPSAGTNRVATVCQDIHTVYGQEDSNELDYAEQGVKPAMCEGRR